MKKLIAFDCDALYPVGSILGLTQDMVNKLGPWKYQFEFLKGIWSIPDIREKCNRPEEHHLPYLAKNLFGGSFEGLRVLDLGCNFGHFSLKAAELGAKEVIGVELRGSNLKRAAFARATRNADNVKFLQGMIEDVTKEELGVFDLVIIAGVFFHLTQPVQVLENIFNMVLHGALIDTNIIPSRDGRPVIQIYPDSPREENWGIRKINFHPSVPALEKMVKSVGFQEMLELPIENNPYLPNGMWLNTRNADKVRRQVFYAFKNTVSDSSTKKVFPTPWFGTKRTFSSTFQGLLMDFYHYIK